MKEHRVSSRYAKALTDVALEQSLESKVVEDIELILAMIASSRELRNLLASPIVSSQKKRAIFKELFESKVSELMMHFVLLVEEKSREAILVDIFNEFTNIYNNRHNILPITISSAYEMNEEEQQKIVARIADITGKTILPVYKIDKTIIGGLSIAYDNLIIDASIKSQLKKLHRSLLAA